MDFFLKIKLYYFSKMIDLKLLEYLESFLTESRRNRFNEVLSMRNKYFTVATEDVYHLHNTSAVMRSCDVFGIQELHVIEEINQKRIDREIALGAQKWVDLFRHKSSAECIGKLRQKGYLIVATSPHKSNVNFVDFDIRKKSCFFFGCEHKGLSDEVMQQADYHIRIPMVGFTESLNVSVSAAIILQNLTFRLRQSDAPWQLTDEERNGLKFNWLKKNIHGFEDIVDRFYRQDV